MNLSKREIGFYIYVTSFSIYVISFGFFLAYPFRLMLVDQVNEDVFIPAILLLPMSLALSIGIFLIADNVYPYFSKPLVITTMILAYVLTLGIGLAI